MYGDLIDDLIVEISNIDVILCFILNYSLVFKTNVKSASAVFDYDISHT